MKSNLKPIQIAVTMAIGVVLICGVMFFLLHKNDGSDSVYHPAVSQINTGELNSGRQPRGDLPAGAPRLIVPMHKKTLQ